MSSNYYHFIKKEIYILEKHSLRSTLPWPRKQVARVTFMWVLVTLIYFSEKNRGCCCYDVWLHPTRAGAKIYTLAGDLCP
jgi:hypothetical protein